MIMYTVASTDSTQTDFGASMSWLKYVIMGVVVLIFADNIFSYGSYGLISRFQYMHWFGGGDIQAVVLMVVLFAGIVWFITKKDPGETT